MRRRKRTEWPYEFSELATYNSERTRGIVHTDEWKARMAEVQQRFWVWQSTSCKVGDVSYTPPAYLGLRE